MIETTGIRKLILGEDESTIDDKGRILVPKKKRERLGEDFFLAIGPIGCLTAYPSWAFERYASQILEDDDVLNFGRDQFSRLFLGTAEDELKFDAQGRFVVPQKLRGLGLLKKDVVLLGAGDRMEIWDSAEYKRFKQGPDEYGFERRDALSKAYIDMTGRMG